MKKLLQCVTILTTLFAAAAIATVFTDTDTHAWWGAARLIAGALVIVSGVIILTASQRRSVPVLPVLTAGILLLVLGAGGAIWTVYLGDTSGDYEYWAIAGNLLIVLQGALAVFGALAIFGYALPKKVSHDAAT